MAKSEYEYEIFQVGMQIHEGLETANAELKQKVDDGWNVQQIFTNSISDGPIFTFALLRRERDESTETYTHTSF